MRQSEQLAKEGTPAVSSIRIQFFPVFVKEIFFVQYKKHTYTYMYTYTYTHICVLFSLYESEFLLISESKQGGFYKNPLLLLVEDIR
jgi:hypothetical protein